MEGHLGGGQGGERSFNDTVVADKMPVEIVKAQETLKLFAALRYRLGGGSGKTFARSILRFPLATMYPRKDTVELTLLGLYI